MIKERNFNIDFLRILACFMVVFLHVSSQTFSSVDVISHEWQWFNIYGSMVRTAVPLFFMISGKLFLARDKCVSIKDIFSKYITKILVVYIVWSSIYAVEKMNRLGLPIEELITLIIDSHFHLWYLPTLISMYLSLPVLWIICHYEDGEYLKYCLIMFFIFVAGKHTVTSFDVVDVNIINIVNKINYPLITYTGYFLLGYYLDKNIKLYSRYKQSHLIILLLIIMFISAFITKSYSFYVGKPTTVLYTNLSLNVIIEAILLFILFLRLNIKVKKKKNILLISKLTLFIYLFHPFVIDFLKYNYAITNLSFDPMVSIPVLSLLVFLVCLIIGFVLDKIPFINKWFM